VSLLLVDTSVWVEYLRGTGSSAGTTLRDLLHDRPDDVAITEAIAMELLAGARPASLPQLELLINALPVLATVPALDFPAAAAAYRAARTAGLTVRSLVDCLIASVAVRTGAELLHRDADYDVLTQVLLDLRVRSVR
jgi:predicted nucleic acid-binding protein